MTLPLPVVNGANVGGGDAAGGSPPSPHRRRRSASGPGRQRGLAAIREQGQVVADYWKQKKARRG